MSSVQAAATYHDMAGWLDQGRSWNTTQRLKTEHGEGPCGWSLEMKSLYITWKLDEVRVCILLGFMLVFGGVTCGCFLLKNVFSLLSLPYLVWRGRAILPVFSSHVRLPLGETRVPHPHCHLLCQEIVRLTVDGSEIPNNHRVDVFQTLFPSGINYQPQVVNAGFPNQQQC